MADVKISALPAATTPLGGTEVLPIVQSGTTKKVSIADVTAGRAMSASSLTLSSPLGVASGGTGLNSLTAGRIPYGDGTSAFGNSANLFFNGTNLGIGTSSPTSYGAGYTTLAVNGSSAGSVIDTSVAGVRIGTFFALSDNSVTVGNVTNNPLAFRTNNIERMRLDASGNFGIGTSSPGAKLNVVGLTSNATATFLSGASGSLCSVNLGRDTRTYTLGVAASASQFFSGTAAGDSIIAYGTGKLWIGSGNIDTAGSATAVFDASGTLFIGSTSGPSNSLTVATSAAAIRIRDTSNTNGSQLYDSTTAFNVTVVDGRPLVFQTGNTERVRIDSSGNLLVGTTSQVGSALTSLFSGTANNTSYRPLSLRGGSQTIFGNRKTTSVSTSATVISAVNEWCNLVLVFGTDGTNRFCDLVLWSIGSGTVNSISSLNSSGSPAARTYSQSSSTLRLAMASGTYSVHVVELTLAEV